MQIHTTLSLESRFNEFASASGPKKTFVFVWKVLCSFKTCQLRSVDKITGLIVFIQMADAGNLPKLIWFQLRQN